MCPYGVFSLDDVPFQFNFKIYWHVSRINVENIYVSKARFNIY